MLLSAILAAASGCAPVASGDYVSPAATRVDGCRPGGYPMGAAVFDESSGFAFDRIESIRGDFPNRDWTFAGLKVGAQCETVEVAWPDGASGVDPIRLELFRALTGAGAQEVALLAIEDGEDVEQVADTIWVTDGRFATSHLGCIAAQVESDNIERDRLRLATLLEALAETSCESAKAAHPDQGPTDRQ